MPTPLELRTTDTARKELILQTLFSAENEAQLSTNITDKVNLQRYAFSLLREAFDNGSYQLFASQVEPFTIAASYIGTSAPSCTVKSTTGYARVIRWDNTVGAVTTSLTAGSPNGLITPNFGTAPATPYNTRLTKFFNIIPCGSGFGVPLAIPFNNKNQGLTYLTINNNYLTSLYVDNANLLTDIDANRNLLESLNVTMMPQLTSLVIYNNLLPTIDVTKNTNLVVLDASTNKLNEINVSNNTNLSSLNIGRNNLTSLDVSNNPVIVEINVSYNNFSIETIDALIASIDLTIPRTGKLLLLSNQLTGALPSSASSDKIALLQSNGWVVTYG